MPYKIINQFTHCGWFKRGSLVVSSSYSRLVNGRFQVFLAKTNTYSSRFFIRQATDEELMNAGLLEIAKGALMLHTEFEIPFSDGREVNVEIDGVQFSGVTLSSIITWHNGHYKILQKGDWSDWGHYYYFLQKITKGENYA